MEVEVGISLDRTQFLPDNKQAKRKSPSCSIRGRVQSGVGGDYYGEGGREDEEEEGSRSENETVGCEEGGIAAFSDGDCTE